MLHNQKKLKDLPITKSPKKEKKVPMFDFGKISKGPEIINFGMQLQSSVADYIRKDPITPRKPQ